MRFEHKIQYASLSDIGFRRRMNQDSFAVRMCTDRPTWTRLGHLFLVADGMGGHAVGELASKIAADTVPHAFFKSDTPLDVALRAAIQNANAAIHDRGTQNHDFHNMGTTCTAAVLGPKGLFVGHVGDSRAYRVRSGRIEQLTFDHSLQWELIRRGVSREQVMLTEPRNVITRSLGPHATVEVDLEGPFPVESDDVYVLCSDGLTTHVEDEEIGIVSANLPVSDACRLLVNLANLRGGADNITVVLMRVGETPAELPDEPPPEPPSGAAWWWLLVMWILAALFVGGLAGILLERTQAGLALLSLGVVGTGTSLIVGTALRRAKNQPQQVSSSPYRAAAARLSPEFVSRLAALEGELLRTAHDEGWEIDWSQHQQFADEAHRAFDASRLRAALAAWAAALDLLMVGVLDFRKRRFRERRGEQGQKTPPASAQGP